MIEEMVMGEVLINKDLEAYSALNRPIIEKLYFGMGRFRHFLDSSVSRLMGHGMCITEVCSDRLTEDCLNTSTWIV